MKTIIRHRACDTDIFEVNKKLITGGIISAHEWEPLIPARKPIPGDMMVCPNCGKPFSASDDDLERTFVG